MKKIIVLFMCVLMVGAMLMSVSATGTATMTITPSSTTAKAGDVVTFTVSVSQLDACTSAGIILSFDIAVYEMENWECLVSGAALPSYDSQTKLLSFANQGKALGGDIFRFTLKVKSSAALGTANVSGTPYLRNSGGAIDATIKAASVTISCKHSYDNSCDTTCNACGATRSITHSWDSGKVTKAATCTEEGTKTYTCTVCGEKKTEKIGATGHKYTNACDTSCNTCGATRNVQHSYSTKWSSDGSKHWHACTVCGEKKDEAKHTPGAAATNSTPQTCTTCGYVLQPALGHTHDFEDTWTKDEMGHWYACSSCDDVKDYENHSYENDCDSTCDVCGYTRETEHIYQEQWASDTNGHWHECSNCGNQLEMEPHIPGPEATADAPQICTVCGYELTPMVGHTHTHTWNSDEEDHWKECVCGNITDQAEHSWDDGIVTKEPEQDVPGVKTYTCSVCGRERTEEISANLPTEGTEPSGTEPQEAPGKTDEGFPWGIVIAAGAGMLVLCGLFLVIGIVIGKKQTGKYSAK